MDLKQIHIAIQCDEGFVADALREIANRIEESDGYPGFIETATYCASITEDGE